MGNNVCRCVTHDKCRYKGEHKCVCIKPSYSKKQCKANNHVCMCITNKTHLCKSLVHDCICNRYSDVNGIFHSNCGADVHACCCENVIKMVKLHGAHCNKPCISHKHTCICIHNPYECRSTNHVCVCIDHSTDLCLKHTQRTSSLY